MTGRERDAAAITHEAPARVAWPGPRAHPNPLFRQVREVALATHHIRDAGVEILVRTTPHEPCLRSPLAASL